MRKGSEVVGESGVLVNCRIFVSAFKDRTGGLFFTGLT